MSRREKTTSNTIRPALAALLAGLLGTFACHTIREELPTGPGPTPAPLIPIAPIGAAPGPTPRPTPVGPGAPGSPAPDEEPLPATPGGGGAPGGGGGGGGSCSDPRPGPLGRIDVKIHIFGASRLILDATPLVGPDADYCKLIGFTDGRRFCPARVEGNPERGACDAALMGVADTGRVGPSWSANGRPCIDGGGQLPFCNNYPDNQFLVFAVGAGTYRACSASGVCGFLTTTQ